MTLMPQHKVLDQLYPLAETQLGYFTTAQAEILGVDRRYLAHHVRSGSLDRVDRGIYRFSRFPIQRFEDTMVAILWVGEGAVASHETALSVYGLADAMPAVTHITVDRHFRGKRAGVIVHHSPLPTEDITSREGIPITTPVRTITDIASDPSMARAAAADALERGLVRRPQLQNIAQEDPELAEWLSALLAQ